MFVSIRSIALPVEVSDADIADLKKALTAIRGGPGVLGSSVVDTLPGAVNGGGIMWRATFADQRACDDFFASEAWIAGIAPRFAHAQIDGADYAPAARAMSRPRLENGVWRLLLLACEPGTDSRWADMEEDHLLMPGSVPEILNWGFGRVVRSCGRRSWTHVWEQEYADLADLNGPYMMRPIHWGVIDRWYDGECPEHIVDPFVVHAVGDIAHSIMAAGA